MPTDRDIALVKAALEAAAEILDKQMWWEGRDKIRAIDPAAIAATVEESEHQDGDTRHRHEIIFDLVDSRKRIYDLEHELAAQRADVNHLNQMLRDKGYGQGEIDAYASQCDELDALRQRIAELERQLAEASPPANKPASPAQAHAPDHSEQR